MELCTEIILKFKRNEGLNLIPAKETKVTSRHGPAGCPPQESKEKTLLLESRLGGLGSKRHQGKEGMKVSQGQNVGFSRKRADLV